MSVQREKLKKFQEQHLESQVQCGDQLKSVPKAGCVKEWALLEIALNLQALNEKLDRLVALQQPEALPREAASGMQNDRPLPRS
ncbi:MAG: hypothetical protein DMG68_08825 [Acidobacteria bacterium]|jgi:hypothetical protein|nr:MAG: hypothetical protein DMG68_08825 [Acidobacteriota bacterium]